MQSFVKELGAVICPSPVIGELYAVRNKTKVMAYAHPATHATTKRTAAIPAATIAWAGTIILAIMALPYLAKIAAYLLMLCYDVLMYY